jgi:hypothetical protein
MYIIAIGWLYVTTLMALSESSIVAGVLTFFFYGLFPVGLLLWLLGTPARRQRRVAMDAAVAPEVANSVGVPAMDELADQPDRRDSQRDQ